MKIYTFITGMNEDGTPIYFMTPCELCCEGWFLIDTREIHFNISTDEILGLAKKSQKIKDDFMEKEHE